MIDAKAPYAEQYFEGRRCGQSGAQRNTNPFFSRPASQAGIPDSEEVWRSKYDIWRQGWMEGSALFKLHGLSE